ncbi:MAG: AzlC family ABC transporter permease [Pelagibacteraceae bacterium]|nr:AzlC family ABC transporter permease [Pelagibacteraceae bacterium]MCI5079469.1 AzlC family ABC transporter permease [Pelagibacteraceae bacterium]
MFSSQSFKDGVKHAIGVPALGLGSSMFAFGAFLHSAGFDIFQSFLSTFFTFALPGQFVMAETILAGGTLLNVFLAVLLTNGRLYPMTVNITPIIRNNNIPKWKQYLSAHFIAVTSWFNMFAVHREINQEDKFDYFVGLGGFLWANSVLCTVAGYLFSNIVSHEILVGMVFINPMYFLIMTVSNLKEKKLICSILAGAILSILLNDLFPGWSVLIAGVTAGTAGYFLFKEEVINE